MFNTAVDRGNYFRTYTGQQFYPGDPRPEEIDIIDIAHALSLTCRFSGHIPGHYSVAQHSVLVSKYVPKEDALWGLLHDASEAYMSDIVSPLKHHPLMAGYRVLEERTMQAVAARFGLQWPMPESIKQADNRLFLSECTDVRNRPATGYIDAMTFRRVDLEGKPYEPIPDKITCWTPAAAEHAFLERFKELTIKGYQGI
jgi:uncharacterized protein